jgi:hypothetical protein
MRQTPQPQNPSRVALLARLVRERARIQEVLPFVVTERRILILLLVWAGPVSVRNVQDAVRGLTRSEYYGKLYRMVHATEAYKQMRQLVYFGALTRTKRGARTTYRLRPSVRRKLARVFDELVPDD